MPFKFFVWLITCVFVTVGLYQTVYSTIKRFQRDIKNAKLKFNIVVVLVWVILAIVISIDETFIQQIAIFVGVVILSTIYFTFFVFKKFNK